MQRFWSRKADAKSSSKRRGSTFIIVCVSIPMMMGFCALAVDYGVLNVDANRLQRASDAAALAGAAELKKTNDTDDIKDARKEAEGAAARNGVDISDLIISFPASSTNEWSANSRIRVESAFTRQLLFARFWKMNASRLGRAATGERTPVKSMKKEFAPLVITTKDYNKYGDGKPLTVQLTRMQSQIDFNPGKVVGILTPTNTDNIDYKNDNSKSPSHWQDEMSYGSQDTVNAGPDGDIDVSLNASAQNQEKTLDDALKVRIDDAKAAGWDPGNTVTTAVENSSYPDYPATATRRIITIAVADETPASTGNQNLKLLKFVRVYIVSTNGKGQIVMRLLPDADASSEDAYTYGDGSTDTGLHVVRLIDDLG